MHDRTALEKLLEDLHGHLTSVLNPDSLREYVEQRGVGGFMPPVFGLLRPTRTKDWTAADAAGFVADLWVKFCSDAVGWITPEIERLERTQRLDAGRELANLRPQFRSIVTMLQP